ncbi:MAG: ECF-type sigma factor [Planctomycetota bacterium]
MDPQPDRPVTQHLARFAAGDRSALDEVLALVYDELRQLANGIGQRAGAESLQPTALVHEAYLRLVGSKSRLNDRQHFLAVAATAMRQVLANHARDRSALKRGGAWQRVTLSTESGGACELDVDALALHEALEGLEAKDPRKARVATLRYFGGLTVAEVAEALEVSTGTVESDWALARAWLARALAEEGR